MSKASNRLSADTILINGNVITVDASVPRAEAVAISSGRLTAVGSESQIRAFTGPHTQTVNLHGRTVIPGLVDNHTHLVSGGASLLGKCVSLEGATNIEEIIRRIKSYAKDVPDGKWIETTFLPRIALDDGRMPNRYDLDAATQRHPVYLCQSGKNAIVNSFALNLAGIDRDTVDPDGSSNCAEGRIVRDETGNPTGHLIAGAGDLARARWWRQTGHEPRLFEFMHLSPEECDRAIELQMQEFNSLGVTSTRDMGATPAELQSYIRTAEAGHATCRMDVMIGVPGSYIPIEEISPVLDKYESLRYLSVKDWVRVAGLKVLIQNDGWWSVGPAKAESLIVQANRRGWTLAFHAGSSVTDEVNSRLVEILEHANEESPIEGRRFSWEHGLGLFDRTLLERMSRLGIVVACQPSLSYVAASRSTHMGPQMDRLGLVKGKASQAHGISRAIEDWGLPIRRWRDAGLLVTLGTDWPASRINVRSPLINIAFSCTQQSSVGVLMPDEIVPAEAGLRMATLDGAFSMFAEDRAGSLTKGKYADLVILDGDPLAVPVSSLEEIRVLATICDGRTVFRAEDLDVDI